MPVERLALIRAALANAPALTLEMPFKDNADLPDPERGWSGARSRRLGADTLTALLAMLPAL